MNLFIPLPKSYEKVALFLPFCRIRNMSTEVISTLPEDARGQSLGSELMSANGQVLQFAFLCSPSDQTARCP